MCTKNAEVSISGRDDIWHVRRVERVNYAIVSMHWNMDGLLWPYFADYFVVCQTLISQKNDMDELTVYIGVFAVGLSDTSG